METDGLKILKQMDSLTIEIGLNLKYCDLYHANLSAVKRLTKTE